MTRVRKFALTATVVVLLSVAGVVYIMVRGAAVTANIMRGVPQLIERAGKAGFRDLARGSEAVFAGSSAATVYRLQKVGSNGIEGGPILIYIAEWKPDVPDSVRSVVRSGEIIESGLNELPALIQLSKDSLVGAGERIALRIDGISIPLRLVP